MNRRYRSHRKNGNYTIPMVSLGIVAAAILLWVIIAKGDDILRYFEGETIYYPDNSEANANLSRLLADLSGDKAQLLVDIDGGGLADRTVRFDSAGSRMSRPAATSVGSS